MLEGEAAALAAQHRSAQDLRAMQRILGALNQAPTLGDAADLDVAFHEAIAIASRNPVIQLMFGSIRNLTHGIVVRSLTDREVRGAGAPLHDVILDGIRARPGPRGGPSGDGGAHRHRRALLRRRS